MLKNFKVPDYFSDYISLKRYLENKTGTNCMRLKKDNLIQTGTSGAVDLSEKPAATITQIAKFTPQNLQVSSSGADAGLEGAIITAHYIGTGNVQKTAIIADAVADMSGGVDFDTAVEDFLYWDIENYGINCFTSSIAVGVGLTLDCGATGSGNAQIIAGALTGTKLSYVSSNTVYGRCVSNHADGVGTLATLDFINEFGEIHEGYTLTLGADSTVELPFLDTNGFPNQDYYSVRDLNLSKAMTANSGEFLLTDGDCSNVDGSGGDVFGGVIELKHRASISKYYVPADAESYLGKILVQSGIANIILSVTFTEKDDIASRSIAINKAYTEDIIEVYEGIELEPLTFLSMTIIGNNAVVNIQPIILERIEGRK